MYAVVRNLFLIFTLMEVLSFHINAQSIETLKENIISAIAKKKADVGVSIMGYDGQDTLSINGDKHLPMQSVFKFHIALAMLSAIDEGRFALNQKITIQKKDLLPGLYSPLRERHPEGVSLGISEILEYTVSQSDNVGCDVLLTLLGGPQQVEAYFRRHGFNDVEIKINEEVMQNNWDKQFLNWTTPKEATKVLRTFFDNKDDLLSPISHDFLLKIMTATSTGKNRIKGKLPPETTVAHKTGWSGTHKTTGITAAVNDIGIVFLPNGKHFFISVLVTNSKENDAINDMIIADVAKVTWDYFMEKYNN